MASVINDPNGRRRIELTGADGKRKRIRLGAMSKKHAGSVAGHLEEMVGAAAGNTTPRRETMQWWSGVDITLRRRVIAAGLMPDETVKAEPTLGSLVADFFATSEVKPASRVVQKQATDGLEAFFGKTKILKDITPLDAQKWRQFLKAKGLAEATVAKRVKIARQLFKAAVRWLLIASSPFADVKTGSQKNKARQFFVSLETYEKLVNACDSDAWKIRFALCRFGGLRMPSETERLKWSDVDWEAGRFKVTSPKTEGHVGGESRLVPLFPELRSVLEQAPRHGLYILGEGQKTNTALRYRALKIFAKAGVRPWPRLFQNMRLS